ncbi:MAG TPA: HD domain-containing phosphohydrolase [Vicinamibacterales bacterium]|nr:HD domain-containing phosphohydrolase [Vicinamibacterales bacterium]
MRAPRLLTRALVASFLTVALVVGAVFAVLSLRVRDQVRQSVSDNLASAQQVFTKVEARRQQDMRASVATLAENPTLKAALDTWLTERSTANEKTSTELVETVQREAKKIAERVGADVLAVADGSRRVVAAGGRLAASWPRGVVIGNAADANSPGDRAISVGNGTYHVVSVPLQLGESTIGSLELGTALDATYARELADLSRGEAAILSKGAVLASTVSGPAARDLAAYNTSESAGAKTMTLAGESWAIQPLSQLGDVTFLALASIDRAAEGQTQAALRGLAWVGLGAMGLAVLGSVWLARTLTLPIDQLSKSLSAMTTGDRARNTVPLCGTSRELDQLATTFNSLLTSLSLAEAEAEATYLGAVRALAAALDARDPYTAGHSERVSIFAVAIGEELKLEWDAMETLRLGALLHDIGKIGVPDEVLRKSGALTAAEFETIKTHPTAGARILRSIPFLAPHIPIVELHHERPDGLGYPYGLKGDDIPLAARIVHVADAFDAMTSARAYRSGRIPVEAIAELRRCVGSDFDGPSVEALIAALPRLVAEPVDSKVAQWSPRARSA